MRDLFETRNISPMLIAENKDPFDSPDYLYELKWDGIRAVAYLDGNETDIRNKRNMKLTHLFPELSQLHRQVSKKCILDGEIFIMKEGKPDFYEIQPRTLMSDPFKIGLKSQQLPASFVAFDILYQEQEQLTLYPLIERKGMLQKIMSESERFAVSRYIFENGIGLYNVAEQNALEGIVAKKTDSKYYFGKRTKDWVKIKYLLDDDYVVLGYIPKDNSMNSIIIGQYGKDGDMKYKGHVTLGVSGQDFWRIRNHAKMQYPAIPVPPGNERAAWIQPDMVCTVKYMPNTKGSLRQAVFKGLRIDKQAIECIEK